MAEEAQESALLYIHDVKKAKNYYLNNIYEQFCGKGELLSVTQNRKAIFPVNIIKTEDSIYTV